MNRHEQSTAVAPSYLRPQSERTHEPVSSYSSKLRPSSFARDALAWIVIATVLGAVAVHAVIDDWRISFGWGALFGLVIMLYRMIVWDRERIQSQRDSEYRPVVPPAPETRVRPVITSTVGGGHVTRIGKYSMSAELARQFACNVLERGRLTRDSIPPGMIPDRNNRYGSDIVPEFQRLELFDDNLALTETGRRAMEEWSR